MDASEGCVTTWCVAPCLLVWVWWPTFAPLSWAYKHDSVAAVSTSIPPGKLNEVRNAYYTNSLLLFSNFGGTYAHVNTSWNEEYAHSISALTP